MTFKASVYCSLPSNSPVWRRSCCHLLHVLAEARRRRRQSLGDPVTDLLQLVVHELFQRGELGLAAPALMHIIFVYEGEFGPGLRN